MCPVGWARDGVLASDRLGPRPSSRLSVGRSYGMDCPVCVPSVILDYPENTRPSPFQGLALGNFYGRISTTVPFGATFSISSISSSVTAMHPFVQSIPE